jgi:hypothetical protein
MDNSGQIPIGRYGVNGKNSLYRKNRLAPEAGKPRYQPESKAGPRGRHPLNASPPFLFRAFRVFRGPKGFLTAKSAKYAKVSIHSQDNDARPGSSFRRVRPRTEAYVKNARLYDIKSLREQKRLNHFEKAADTIEVTAEETALKLTDREFLKQLNRYIQFRGIDIVLHMRDGSVVELDKNRRMDGRMIICHNRTGGQEFIAIDDIRSAEFFAA